MRKLKNLELLGETRLIPGVGHVTFEENVPEHVAEACDALGLDWVAPLSLPTESENSSDGGDEAGAADADGGETPRMASVLNGDESNSKRKKK